MADLNPSGIFREMLKSEQPVEERTRNLKNTPGWVQRSSGPHISSLAFYWFGTAFVPQTISFFAESFFMSRCSVLQAANA